ncbi:MAG: hypothetical protein IID08_07920 [Candidatus Hydrogenedentes bacterium]|nr:hypothetical protein [Candidatus Hydrogenedentota bacterium]
MSADALIRAGVQDLPVPEFDEPAFTTPPALKDATVAIVTTAGFRRPGQESWAPFDQSYRVFKAEERDLRLGHLSPNFDRSGFAVDINVVYPIDRLNEMAEEGVLGGVSPIHISFMGAQDESMTSIRMDSGPAAAKELKDAGVDVVLLTPV